MSMTKGKWDERNLLIAEFFADCEFKHRTGGFYFKKAKGKWGPIRDEETNNLFNKYPLTKDISINYCMHIDSLKFHESWDWIMPVVSKIEDLGFKFIIETIYNNQVYINISHKDHDIIKGFYNKNSKLFGVYDVISSFIKYKMYESK